MKIGNVMILEGVDKKEEQVESLKKRPTVLAEEMNRKSIFLTGE